MTIKTKQWRLTVKCLALHKYNIHKILLLCSVANLSNCLKFWNHAKHSPATSYDLHSCLYINNSLKRKDHLTGSSSFVLIFNGFKRKLLWLSQKCSKRPGGPLAKKCNRKLGASHPMLLHTLSAYWPQISLGNLLSLGQFQLNFQSHMTDHCPKPNKLLMPGIKPVPFA